MFCICKVLSSQLALNTYKAFYERLIFFKHLVVALRYRTRYNKRCTGIINQYRVHLVDDSIVMAALYEVGRRDSHIVAQVVETELIVGTESDVCLISLATSLGVGLMLVNAVYRETVEHIEWSHPLGVTLSQIVVDSHYMHTITRKGVKEHRQGGHKRLTLTSSHLGNLTLVEYCTTEELYVIVNHLPFQVVATSRPVVMIDSLVAIDGDKVLFRVGSQFAVEVSSSHYRLLVLGKASCSLLDDAESHRHHLVQGLLILVESLLVEFVYLVEDRFALVYGCIFDCTLQTFYLLTLRLSSVLYKPLYLLCLSPELVVVKCLYLRIYGLYLVYVWLYQFHVTC